MKEYPLQYASADKNKKSHYRDLQVTKLYVSPRLMKILNMGDSINCERSEQPERLQGAGPPGVGCPLA